MPLTTVEAPVNIVDTQTYYQAQQRPSKWYFTIGSANGAIVELARTQHPGVTVSMVSRVEAYVLVDISQIWPKENGGHCTQKYLDRRSISLMMG
jgi:hypothetical protein